MSQKKPSLVLGGGKPANVYIISIQDNHRYNMYTNGYKDTYNYIYAHELTIDDGLGVCNPGVISEKKNIPPKQINQLPVTCILTSPYFFCWWKWPFSSHILCPHFFFVWKHVHILPSTPPGMPPNLETPHDSTTPIFLEELAHQPWWEDQFRRIGTMLWSFGWWCLHTPCLGGWNFWIPLRKKKPNIYIYTYPRKSKTIKIIVAWKCWL